MYGLSETFSTWSSNFISFFLAFILRTMYKTHTTHEPLLQQLKSRTLSLDWKVRKSKATLC